jgi:uncharacterized protein YodC (DUF2158 family)
MSDQFQVGDIVQLRSGGPEMTVDHIGKVGGTKKARCIWFAKTYQDRKEGLFALPTLKKVNRKSRPLQAS